MNTQPLTHSSGSARPFLLGWLVYAGIVTAILIARLVAFPGLNEAMDFRQLYTGGVLVRTDPADLYNFQIQKDVENAVVSQVSGFLPFNHPPYEAMLFAPFSRLSYEAGYLTFVAVNLVLLLACFFVARPLFSRAGGVAQPRPGLQFFAFLPVIMGLLQGQNAILFFLGLCVTFRALQSDRRFAAGAVLGLLLFKPQLALALAAFLAVRFGASFVAGFVAAGSLVTLVSAIPAGWRTLAAFVRVLALTGTSYVAPGARYGALGVVPLAMPNLRGLLFPLSAIISSRSVLAVTLALSAAVALWAFHVLTRGNLDLELGFAFATVAAVLLSYHLSLQDLTILLLPFALVAGKSRKLTRAVWSFYLAPPLLFIASVNTLFLLALPAGMFLLEICRTSQQQSA